MQKITALHKRATFLRNAEASALTRWREPDWNCLRPGIIEVRYKREKTQARYWANALSTRAADGLQRSLKGRTFLVVDLNSSCLIGLLAYSNAKKKDDVRDKMIGWGGEWRERRASRMIDLVRCLVTEPFARVGGGRFMMQVAACDEIIDVLEKRASVPIAAISLIVDDAEACLHKLPHGKDFEPPWFDRYSDAITARILYVAEIKEGGCDYLRGEIDELSLKRNTRPFAQLANRWMNQIDTDLIPTPWDANYYSYERLMERFDAPRNG